MEYGIKEAIEKVHSYAKSVGCEAEYNGIVFVEDNPEDIYRAHHFHITKQAGQGEVAYADCYIDKDIADVSVTAFSDAVHYIDVVCDMVSERNSEAV